MAIAALIGKGRGALPLGKGEANVEHMEHCPGGKIAQHVLAPLKRVRDGPGNGCMGQRVSVP